MSLFKFLKYFIFPKYKQIDNLHKYLETLLELDPNKYVPLTEYKTFRDILQDHFRKKKVEEKKKVKPKNEYEIDNEDMQIIIDLCNINIGYNYKIDEKSLLYKTLGSQSLNVSVEVGSFMDMKLQILLNIKLIFNDGMGTINEVKRLSHSHIKKSSSSVTNNKDQDNKTSPGMETEESAISES